MDLLVIPYPLIDPVALAIGPVSIRWYGLAYMAGILLGWLYARRLVSRPDLWGGKSPLTISQADDFLLWITLGIVVGGRVGFVLFYEPSYFWANPIEIPAVWNGGMSFHGGLLGVALVALTTNLLAAALALAGGLVYVFVYTMWLKRSTAQNIVIGGAAGAFPPLVGWAAATGSLSPLAWVLFAIVFFWTPPHFWALALLLSKQYSVAKIPMLPVVVGERRTRRSILFYTVLLFAISLVPLVWLGPIYAVAAIALGGAFLALAGRATRRRDGASAVVLFHYSLAYLALLFPAAALASVVRL